MARRRRSTRRRSRSGRFYGLYILLSAVLIVVAIVAGCIVFFRVNDFEVSGNSKYTAEEVVEASGIHLGDNLCLIKRTEVAKDLLAGMPYIQSVNIQRKMPDTVVINLTETVDIAAIQNGTSWWLANSVGKLLEPAGDPGNRIQVLGLELLAPSIGTQMAVDVDHRLTLNGLLKLFAALDGRDLLGNVNWVDLTNESQITMLYGNRLTVIMPIDSDFEYNAKMLSAVLEEYIATNWTASDTGTLDMTYDDGHPHLTKDKTSR